MPNEVNINIRRNSKTGEDNSNKLLNVVQSDYELNMNIGLDDPVSYNFKWNDEDASSVIEYIRMYRSDPGNILFKPAISTLLWKFLFKNLNEKEKRNLLNLISIEDITLYLSSESEDQRILTNIPWELALKVYPDEINQDLDFDNTLSAFPCAKLVKGTSSRSKPFSENLLKISCCISDPYYKGKDDNSLEPDDFYRDIKSALESRSLFIQYELLIGDNDFLVDFDEFTTRIKNFDPNILILVCHGKTQEGKPMVYFNGGWIDIEILAAHLKDTSIHMVYLIACDLTYFDDGVTSNSGAITLVNSGIPAVVAMQSSTLVTSGNIFIKQLIEYVFANSKDINKKSLPESIYLARSDISRRQNISGVEWSFPSLFLSSNHKTILDRINQSINYYPVSLNWLWRQNFKNIKFHFKRMEIEDVLYKTFKTSSCGIYYIYGPKHSGKTHLIHYIGDKLMRLAIEEKRTDTPLLLYLNFEEYVQHDLSNITELYGILKSRIGEIQPPDSVFTFFKQLGSLTPSIQQNFIDWILTKIDEWKVKLIFDNLSDTQYSNLKEFINQADNKLKYSQIIICFSTGAISKDLNIGFINETEVHRFMHMRNVTSKDFNNINLFELAGGNFYLLNKLIDFPKLIDSLEKDSDDIDKIDDVAFYILKDVQERLGDKHLVTLIALSLVPKGLNKELSHIWLQDWQDLEVLREYGYISSTFRKNDEWFFVPYVLGDSWKVQYSDKIEEVFEDCVIHFAKSNNAYEKNQNTSVFNYILNVDGGYEFVHSLLINLIKNTNSNNKELYNKRLKLIKSIPLATQNILYSKGMWYESFELWNILLTEKKEIKLDYGDWILFGKSASLIGNHNQADYCLNKSKSLEFQNNDKILLIDRHLLEALILKNKGQHELKNIKLLYDESYKIINTELCKTKTDKNLKIRKALNRYDYAIIKAWWEKDISSALALFEEAFIIYEEINDELMKHIIMKEKADILIDFYENTHSYNNEIEENLFKSKIYFERQNNLSELVEVYYRLARYYRKKINHSDNHYLNLSLKYYEKSSETAQMSRNIRFELFAKGHIIILKFRHELVETSKAISELDAIIQILKKDYSVGSWENRIIRNFLWAVTQMYEDDQSYDRLSYLKEAFYYGTSHYLSKDSLSDKKQLSNILKNIIVIIFKEEDKLKEFYYEYTSKLDDWFNIKNFNAFIDENFINSLC